MSNATATKSRARKAKAATAPAHVIKQTASQPPVIPAVPKLDDALKAELYKLGEDCAISELLGQTSQEAFNTIFGAPGLDYMGFELRRIEWVRGYMGKMESGADAAKMAFSRRCKAGQITKPKSEDADAIAKAEQREKAAAITQGIIARYTLDQLQSKANAAHAAGDKAQRAQFEKAVALKIKQDKADHAERVKELRAAIVERVKLCDSIATLEDVLAKLPGVPE